MQTPKKRNPYAVAARLRKAGRHVDRKKKANKNACRRKVDPSE